MNFDINEPFSEFPVLRIVMRKQSDILDGFLVIDFQNGNKKALALLVKRWHDKFCYQAFGYTRNIADAQDIVQDSWQVIMAKIDQLRDPNSFKSWAMRIVVRKSIDWVRNNKTNSGHTKELIQEGQAEPDQESYRLNIEKIKAAIYDLPEKQQQVLQLFYIQEYSLAEIASILEVSSGTVKSRLFYAREQLKQILKL